jgi:hypothetical protein
MSRGPDLAISCIVMLGVLVGACKSPDRETGAVAAARSEPLMMSQGEIPSQRGFVEKQLTVDNSDCPTPPTLDEVLTAKGEYKDYYYSAKQAFSLGIPVVNLKGAKDYLVIVRDYRRFKSCMGRDGKTTNNYGQTIRAVIEVLSYDGSVKANVATIAADATINGKQQFFYLYREGFYHPDADAKLAEVSGKVFDVENYGLYQSIMPTMIALLSNKDTKHAVQRIQVIPPDDDPSYAMAPVRSYAFAQILRDKSCQDAAKRFAKSPERAAAVVDAYTFLSSQPCGPDAPSGAAKDKAKAILADIKVQ